MSDDSHEPPVLEITGLCLSYHTRAGEVPAVYDFDLTVAKGESVGLVGESGCGKSTVANGIMRYMGHNGDIVGGTIKFKGRDMAEMSEEEIRRVRGKDIAMIYQEPMASLNPSLTLGAQLMEVPIIHEGVSRAEAFQRAYDMLAAVDIPDPKRLMISYPHQVSGGQQQRVVIAMALLSQPALLLLDEPTTALDVTVEAGIVELIAELSRKTGSSLLYISHNLGLMLEVCDRICVMYSGEVVEEGTIDSIFSWPKHPYTQGLFGCIPLPHADKNARPLVSIKGQLPLPHQRPEGCNFGPRCGFFAGGRCDTGLIPIEKVHTDDDPAHRVRCTRWNEIDVTEVVRVEESREPIDVGETVLEVTNMRKYYKVRDRSFAALLSGGAVREVKANESINFRAGEGETVAIVGESGCGKSTFAKVLMGLETATDGEVRLDGTDLGAIPVNKRTAAQLSSLQMVFQNPNDTLNPSHSVGYQIGRVIKRFGIERNSIKRLERVQELLDTVKLPRSFVSRKPRQLSGGQKQRVGIARAFAGNPKTVIAGRADLGARRLGCRRGDGAADGHSARAPHHAALHQPRSLGGALSRRPRGGDVPRADHGARLDGRSLLAALSPLHRSVAFCGADCRPRGREAAYCPARLAAEPARPAEGVPVLDALPAQARRNLRDRAAPAQNQRQPSRDCLPYPARGAARGRARDLHSRPRPTRRAVTL